MIKPITPLISPINFMGKHRHKMNGGNPDLKLLWDQGKLPDVKYGFYGDELTSKTVTREHLLPASLGGTKKLGNIVLASKEKNNARGNKDILQFANLGNIKRYLSQFWNLKIKELDGHKYIKACLKTLEQLGLKL